MGTPSKKALNDHIVDEWNVARRTAEFFDEQIGKLREVAFTVSAALLGAAFQFRITVLFLLVPLLELGFFLIDIRYQTYLDTVSKYAKDIEKDYQFASQGITNRIDEKRGPVSVRWLVFFLYACFAAVGVYGLIPYLTRFSDC